MKIFTLCKKYLKTQWYRLIAFVMLSVVGSMVGIVAPYVLGDFMDTLVAGADYESIKRFCLIFGGISLFKIVKDYLVSILNTKMKIRVSYDFNMDLIKYIQKLSVAYIEDKDVAYLNQRLSGDTYTLVAFVLGFFKDVITNAVLFIVPMVVLFFVNKFVLILLSGFIIVYAIVYLAMKKCIYETGFKYREQSSRFWAKLFEQLKFVSQIKAHSIQEEFNARADKAYGDYEKAAIKNQRINHVYYGIDGIVVSLAQIVLFVVGGILVIKGEFTIGLFTIFSSYFKLMLGSLSYFFNLAATFSDALVSLDRILTIQAYEDEPDGYIELKSIDKIDLCGVSFSYGFYNAFYNYLIPGWHETEETLRDAVDNVYYSFTKGKMYALTGRNGAGKSTLAKLIIGLYKYECFGKLMYNDTPLITCNIVKARKKLIGYAEQHPLLAEGDLVYNITYEDVDEDTEKKQRVLNDILKYARILNAEKFIEEAVGYSNITADNNNLSGGERQKIAILRALYKNPDLLVLDEPTAPLDKETKRQFMEYLSSIKKDKIIIIVTHDKDVLPYCDEELKLPMENREEIKRFFFKY